VGSQGADVTALQNLLSYLGPYSGPVTGYFGPLTGTVVGTFQEKYGIASSGDVGHGNVGPMTRAKLNAILSDGA
jgi:N-acetylmuramoyl-L-alanine amidase